MSVVILGGREYEVHPLRWREAAEWRGRLEGLLAPVFARTTPGVTQLSDVVRAVAPSALTPDAMLAFVLGWDDALEDERERILDALTQDELTSAFGVLLDLAYPFVAPPAAAIRSANGAPPQRQTVI